MSKSGILIKNEVEGNKLSAQIMLISIVVLSAVYGMEYLGIFTDDLKKITVPFIVTALIVLAASLVVYIFTAEAWWVKYMMVTASGVAIAIINMYLSKDVVILYIYAIVIASLYFHRGLCWYSVILSMVLLTVSQYLGTYYRLFQDSNYSTMNTVLIPVLSRDIQLLVLALIFISLAKKTKKMLENVMGAEEQKNLTNRMASVIGKSTEVSGVLADSVRQLSGITEHTIRSNEQIAESAAQAASGSDDTLRQTDTVVDSVVRISGSLNHIADEGRFIADISQQVNDMNKKSAVVIKDAVEEMRVIEQTTAESKDLIYRLGERSSEIGRIIEIITGISGQTNLLALNAAIESARAGEQGKGFAVVADEIRKLAEQSKESAKDISALIREVLAETEKAVQTMDRNVRLVGRGMGFVSEAGKSFERVAVASREVNGKINQVSSLTQELASESNKIVDIVHNIKDINHKSLGELQGIATATEQQLSEMQQVAASVGAIERVSNELMEAIREK